MSLDRTIWPAEPHTLAKIAILRDYLVAWFSIMGRSKCKPLLYIDGFAGPGEYTNGPPGSPLAAIEALSTAHRVVGRDWKAQGVHCVFIEERSDRYANLIGRIAGLALASDLNVHPYNASFTEALRTFAQEVPKSFEDCWPRFVFIDPFGAKGVPFTTVQGLLGSPCAEVLVNLDANGIRRILDAGPAAAYDENLTEIFGDRSWRDGIDPHADSRTKEVQVLQLYKSRLRTIPNVRYAWAFEMATQADRLEYYLVFASQHPLGLEKMKEAMKRMAQQSEYRFSDHHAAQPELDLFNSDDPTPWAQRLFDTYRGTSRPYQEARDFALNDTPFLNPKSMLKALAASGSIEIIPRPGMVIRRGFPAEKIERIRFRS